VGSDARRVALVGGSPFTRDDGSLGGCTWRALGDVKRARRRRGLGSCSDENRSRHRGWVFFAFSQTASTCEAW
jgi:hypothetical protein